MTDLKRRSPVVFTGSVALLSDTLHNLADALTAILTRDPQRPSAKDRSIPRALDRIVLRCLRKDPSKRWQNLSDLGAVLEDLKEDTESARKIMVEVTSGRRRVSLRLAAGIAAVVVVFVSVLSIAAGFEAAMSRAFARKVVRIVARGRASDEPRPVAVGFVEEPDGSLLVAPLRLAVEEGDRVGAEQPLAYLEDEEQVIAAARARSCCGTTASSPSVRETTHTPSRACRTELSKRLRSS